MKTRRAFLKLIGKVAAVAGVATVVPAAVLAAVKPSDPWKNLTVEEDLVYYGGVGSYEIDTSPGAVNYYWGDRKIIWNGNPMHIKEYTGSQ